MIFFVSLSFCAFSLYVIPLANATGSTSNSTQCEGTNQSWYCEHKKGICENTTCNVLQLMDRFDWSQRKNDLNTFCKLQNESVGCPVGTTSHCMCNSGFVKDSLVNFTCVMINDQCVFGTATTSPKPVTGKSSSVSSRTDVTGVPSKTPTLPSGETRPPQTGTTPTLPSGVTAQPDQSTVAATTSRCEADEIEKEVKCEQVCSPNPIKVCYNESRNCSCQTGLFRSAIEDGKCVTKEECKRLHSVEMLKTHLCPPGEVYGCVYVQLSDGQLYQCEKTCEIHISFCSKYEKCVAYGCLCQHDFVRYYQGQCIEKNACTASYALNKK